MNHRPRKRFGQHFLHDPNILEKMVRAIAPRADQQLVEIGPGQGALTLPLLKAAHRLTAIELDRDLLAPLQTAAAPWGALTLHNVDALRFDFTQLSSQGQPLRVVGNLPYNISTPLIFHLLAQASAIEDMHFLLQKEVVERLAAAPGSKTFGRLSVMVQYRCAVEPLFDVAPGAFKPPPKVASSFVRLTPFQPQRHVAVDEPLFERVVQAAFAQRRKTLRKSLQPLLTHLDFNAAAIDPGLRPEQLTIEDFVRLSNSRSSAPIGD